MKEKRLALFHRVLIIAKQGQAGRDEIIERLKRLRAAHRPCEVLQLAEIASKALRHKGQNLLRESIRLEADGGRGAQTLWQRLAVFGIKIPFAACGLVAFHQKAGGAAHVAIEKFHPQLLALADPARKIAAMGDEAIILADINRDAAGRLKAAHGFQHAPFAGPCGNDARRLEALAGALHFAGK